MVSASAELEGNHLPESKLHYSSTLLWLQRVFTSIRICIVLLISFLLGF